MLATWALAAGIVAAVMPIDAVQKGQKGTCLTVFEGDAIEPFEFVVKGVMRDYLGPGRDLVLIRLLGDKPEFTGVVAGMSGSPCSIDGKIVGALGYSFARFAKEPIAGVTPINDMRALWKLPPEDVPWRQVRAPVSKPEELLAVRPRPSADAAVLQPIAAPLSLGGVPPELQEYFRPWLESVGFMPVGGGAAAPSPQPSRPVQGGDAVAAVLVRGDVTISATGTVTEVDGSKLLAFGHPFLGAGAISVPMARATIINTMATQERSFKMSLQGDTIGELTQDRLTAIAGVLGKAPPMLPVRGSVTTPFGTHSFAFEVVRDLMVTPQFVMMGLASALSRDVPVGPRGLMRHESTIFIDGHEPLVIRGVHSSERWSGLMVAAAIDVAFNLIQLWDTPFGAPPSMRIEVRATLEADPIIEWIDTVHVDAAQARPGDTLQLAARLQRVGGGQRTERFTLQVPKSWAGQRVELYAASGTYAEGLERRAEGSVRPRDLEDIRRRLARQRTDDKLYIVAMREGVGLTRGVDAMPFLPGSAVAIISGDELTHARQEGVAWEEHRRQPGVLVGGAKTAIKVLEH